MFALKQKQIELRGSKIMVRELSAGARADVVAASKDSVLRAQIVTAQLCAFGDDGKPLAKTFDEAASWPPEVVEAVASEAMSLSGVGASDPKG